MNTRSVIALALSSGLAIGLGLLFIVWGIMLNLGSFSSGNLSIAFGSGFIFGFSIGAGYLSNKALQFSDRPIDLVEDDIFVNDEDHEPEALIIDREGYFLHDGLTVELLTRFASVVIKRGGSISHAIAGAQSSITRAEYEAVRDFALKQEWIKWNNPDRKQLGLSPTRDGITVFNALRRLNTHTHT